ncbi:hypothetical protein GCM10009744_48680 [Kribbella alba]|uniref:Uncharacterized protein n=1 Tax=Kribbella alba TaxID=190197 RepID=A0ABP4RJH2_9ACTN
MLSAAFDATDFDDRPVSLIGSAAGWSGTCFGAYQRRSQSSKPKSRRGFDRDDLAIYLAASKLDLLLRGNPPG